MLEPDVTNVTRLLQSISDDSLIHDANKTATLRALKHLWCHNKCYNYNLLQYFLDMLDDDELTWFVKNVHVTKRVQEKPMWEFDNTKLFNTLGTPDVFVWLQNNNGVDNTQYNVEDVIDAMGQYCVASTRSTLERIVREVFVQKPYHNFLMTLRARLLDANILYSPPLRNDVCYRFTQFVQKIRDTVRVY
uniref:Uncharacterized protein n=1 Tax=Erinnyis ello granulovirus TaxID=307444 RepID=A0A288WJ22_9BBAC|nr:hypothetical protein EREL_075 [Erinnyis ello granulovirus]